jgi:hypothetical protein
VVLFTLLPPRVRPGLTRRKSGASVATRLDLRTLGAFVRLLCNVVVGGRALLYFVVPAVFRMRAGLCKAENVRDLRVARALVSSA